MKIENEIYHLISQLLEQQSEDLETATTTIYSYFDKKHKFAFPTYKHEPFIHKMVDLHLIKIINQGNNSEPVSTSEITEYPFYQVEFSPKKLKALQIKNRSKFIKQNSDLPENINTSERPFCVEEKEIGYLKFSKFGEKIIIGNLNSRHYLFLKEMLNPDTLFAKLPVERVFEVMKQPKDKNDPDLAYSNYTKTKLEKIEFAIKELQKKNRLRGKIKFKFNEDKTMIWLVFIQEKVSLE